MKKKNNNKAAWNLLCRKRILKILKILAKEKTKFELYNK